MFRSSEEFDLQAKCAEKGKGGGLCAASSGDSVSMNNLYISTNDYYS